MGTLETIRNDLLSRDEISLAYILLKAKILASELKSIELRDWVTRELNGYQDAAIPDYRIIRASCKGFLTNGFKNAPNIDVGLRIKGDPDLLRFVTTVEVRQGIKALETLAKDDVVLALPPLVIQRINQSMYKEDRFYFTEATQFVGRHNYEQILDVVKNRLVDFIVSLGEEWNLEGTQPSSQVVDKLTATTIYNMPGANVSIFDQHGQTVNNQYNAARDINFNSAQDIGGFVAELQKLLAAIEKVKSEGKIENTLAIKAQYHVLQAVEEAQSEKPNKATLLDHIGKAKSLLDDVTAAVGLVTAMMGAIEVAQSLFS